MFNFIKKLFMPKQKNKPRPKHLAKNSVSMTRNAKNFKPKTIENSDKLTITSKQNALSTKNPATILVKFLNANQDELRSQLIFKSYLGEPLRLTIPQFKNYIFKKIEGMTSIVVATQQTIIIHYKKKLGKPVMVYCFDYDNNTLLKVPEFMTGEINEHYQVKIPAILGYQLHISIGDLDGIFNNEPQNVILYYRHDNWKLVQPVNYLVKIKLPAVVYSHALEKSNYDFKLPVGSVWKVFKEVHTNEQTWLSLGGAEWIKQEYVTKINDETKKIN
ncbi:MucBP domain-containing protein [Fructilactobacillus sanfranciscensis]|uniref:MucBP domain-containing protein n=1 Tax=Fructilactobacillus sanfranciscensis TaxID=1625 RepID=UPI000CD3EE33|nr:MucBP domain-containing protein [Fructilactobacillus sanfranciscensis]NDR70106.1 hypothetical protein [Fructilactobacillus sanfranciscensis]NDS16760.1 hypothetical protein [Fructilactobacillus sanfranciscensis]POH13148.1 hypothetical protein BGL41_04770 [Fructilactobacillus sanfranciscensis]POH20212.1 hypothetical protein BGL46_03460 [Fructilactobacillus sanfranciscensis]TNK97316.1 hypothetical protein DKP75_04530 [Fructilactobacillus sanfranciscensis]